jgi:hypothetical protein
MSLINEALKKAQRQRTGDPVDATPSSRPVPTGGGAGVRVAKRRPPMPARTQMLLIAGSAALLLMSGAVAFIFLIGEPEAPPPVRRPVVVAKPVPVTPAPVPPVAPTRPRQPDVTLTLPESPAERIAAAAAKTAAAAKAEKLAAQPVGPVANPRVHEFLDALRITGIRVSDTDPKVIMNDRVFRLNDLVDRATGLRLTVVEPSTLTFVDQTGFEYRKNF